MARIGAMREALTLQSNTLQTSTGTGFSSDGWATFATVPGEYLQPDSGRESWQQSAVVAELGPTFRIRHRTDVEPKQRVLWKGQTLQIHAVIPVMRVGQRFLLLETGLTQ
jgi:SPP1 family predicted phage head-tail adaptor